MQEVIISCRIKTVFKTEVDSGGAGIDIKAPGIQGGLRLGGIIYPAFVEDVKTECAAKFNVVFFLCICTNACQNKKQK